MTELFHRGYNPRTLPPVEMSPRKWASSWRKFPISIWMQEQEGRSWFAIHRDSLRVAFECDPFHTKVIQSRGKPFLKLPTVDEEPGRQTNGGCHLFPGPLLPSPPPTSRFTTHVPVYDLTAAAGFWGPESQPEELGWTEVPGVAVKPGMFVARVTGTSMEPLIPDGSWCLFRPCPAGSREGRIVLVQFAVKRRGRERRTVHRQEVPLGAIYRFGGHRRRLAALFDSAPAGESRVRADHARARGLRRPHDRWGVCSRNYMTDFFGKS